MRNRKKELALTGKHNHSVLIVLPAYNEERALEGSVATLHRFLRKRMSPYAWRLLIADNASTDGTQRIGKRLAESIRHVEYLRIGRKGRGRALRRAWFGAKEGVLSYMDIDLSTDLHSFPQLIALVATGKADIVTGSRLLPQSERKRKITREILSRVYNSLVRLLLRTRIHDLQCGFKAVSRKVARKLIPSVKDDEWFFDTELLILAEHFGYRVTEIPVRWTEDLDSKVEIMHTVGNYLRSVQHLRKRIKKMDSSHNRFAKSVAK